MTNRFIIILASLLFVSNLSFAQSAASVIGFEPINFSDTGLTSGNTIFKTLHQDNLLKITIETDFDYLIENKRLDQYQDASLTMNKPTGPEIYKIEVKARGKFRRRTCDFPPLKVKFKKKGLTERGISTSHKSLKLVTHCLDAEDADQTLLKEYIAYKMYNQLTDASFKVQLVEVTYANSAKDTLDEVRYGFIIEDTDELAERIGGVELENHYNLSLDSINGRYEHLIPMFQYMISNLDWRPHMLQNVKIVQMNDGEKMMVPYDFDFAGLVNAPYAKPNSDYRQTNVRQRIYAHKVDDLSELKSTIRFFRSNKRKIIDTIKSCEYLSKKNRREMVRYINEFYQTIDDPNLARQAFQKSI